jgi:hypothetical protein
MNIIEPPVKLSILLSGPTLKATDFSLRSSYAASTERLPEIIPYRTEERGGSCLPVVLILSELPSPLPSPPLPTPKGEKKENNRYYGTVSVRDRYLLKRDLWAACALGEEEERGRGCGRRLARAE